MSAGVRRTRPDERAEGPATAGMIREEAVATDVVRSGSGEAVINVDGPQPVLHPAE